MSVQIHSVKGQQPRYEAQTKLNRAKQKIEELFNEMLLLGNENVSGLEPVSSKQLSREEKQALVQNDALSQAARQGRDAEDVAISSKINLEMQTQKAVKITDGVVSLRNEDIRRGSKLVADYDYMRKRNLCILFSIGALLFLALFY
eukprot:CAMPEP_0170454408 /NCGR_PEP_ID=MMETSP0123-20130129/2668_1 /TAXON_ID=182087 /ORGANISM="Favella ehrenbergii, Strain Fehren 1" /LENGTH=145 /DNA_ID=CAMNT_0010717107 /DNA_START=99 /DNA_END=533 /DNA_ORIENTATION=-